MGNIEMIILRRMEELDKEIWHAVDMQEKCRSDAKMLAFWEQEESKKIGIYMELRRLLTQCKA